MACSTIEYLLFNLKKYDTKVAQYNKRDHIVVPVTMLTEGVHFGSGGPIFYPSEEISKFPAAWNGRPVPIYHPEENGFPVSANSPSTLDSNNVGYVFGAKVLDNGKKLIAELWLDIERLAEFDAELLRKINAKEDIEVSTGLFLELDGTSGEWNGKKYMGVARNFRPDHLAILPTGTGACSVKDGCGIRANTQETKTTIEVEVINQKGEDDMKKREEKIKFLNDNGVAFDVKDTVTPDSVIDNLVKLTQDSLNALQKMTEMEGITNGLREEIKGIKEQVTKTEIKVNTVDEYIAHAPEEIRNVLSRALANDRKKKGELVTYLAANQKAFTADELNGKGIDELEKMLQLLPAKTTVDNGVQQGNYALFNSQASIQHAEEPMATPVLNFGTK